MYAGDAPRRIRHITSIQVRNLTPFPGRDEFASAITQPLPGHIHSSANGHYTDDLDATLTRRRGRRISSSTIRSGKSDHSLEPTPIRRKTSDAGSIGRGGSPTVRPSFRTRTASMISSHSPFTQPSWSAMLPDNSQDALETVLRSRLVETFIAITIADVPEPIPIQNVKTALPEDHRSQPNTSHRQDSSSSSLKSHRATKLSLKHVRSKTPNGVNVHASQPPNAPDYISPIHRPSTNPLYAIDARTTADFAEGTDLSAQRIHVEIYGNLHSSSHYGKGKMKMNGDIAEDTTAGWKVLKEWDIDLTELVPEPDDLISKPSRLPSNTLIVSLDHHPYYIPIPSWNEMHISPSPVSEYNSDTEHERRSSFSSSIAKPYPAKDQIIANNHINGKTSKRGKKQQPKTMAGWQDLVKLVTLQTVIQDTEGSLMSVIRHVDHFVDGDVLSLLRRDISNQQEQIREIKQDTHTVSEAATTLRQQLDERRAQIQRRREMLAFAREDLQLDVAEESLLVEATLREQHSLSTLRGRLSLIRTTLVTTLASIYPIELVSPPDLLFTILYAPLPLPISLTDPAPPLTLSDHPECNEDSLATALGYAAQVVQALAGYLGKSTVYPITCVGSKSLIKDGISAMVGPRMFPLFPKGVDTYRFEYGVFLLNKNIEMLMADRDLHTLDMRHTLPNLKNLLLTLTDGDTRPKTPPIPQVSVTPSTPESGLLKSDTSIAPETPQPTSYFSTSKSLLGLSGFFRSRPPSIAAKPSVTSVEEATETPTNRDISLPEDDPDSDDDRRTIRGVSTDPMKVEAAENGLIDREEKAADSEIETPPTQSTAVAIATA